MRARKRSEGIWQHLLGGGHRGHFADAGVDGE